MLPLVKYLLYLQGRGETEKLDVRLCAAPDIMRVFDCFMDALAGAALTVGGKPQPDMLYGT